MTEENLQKANEVSERLGRLRQEVSFLKSDGFKRLAQQYFGDSTIDAMKDAGLGVAEVELDAAQDEFNNL